MCSGHGTVAAEDLRRNFMQSTNRTDSCEIRICQRWRKSYCRGHYDSHGCIRDDIDTSYGLQRVCADSSFGATQLRRSSVVLVSGDNHAYWFAPALLYCNDKSDGITESGFSVRRPTDNEMDHSETFSPSHCKWLGLKGSGWSRTTHHSQLYESLVLLRMVSGRWFVLPGFYSSYCEWEPLCHRSLTKKTMDSAQLLFELFSSVQSHLS